MFTSPHANPGPSVSVLDEHATFNVCVPGNAAPVERPPESLSLAETARLMRELLSALETRTKSIADTTAFAVDHAARGGAECIADVIAEWATSVRARPRFISPRLLAAHARSDSVFSASADQKFVANRCLAVPGEPIFACLLLHA